MKIEQVAQVMADPAQAALADRPVLRDERGHFLKGTKALNPGGRTRGISAAVRDLIGNNGEDALNVLHEIMMGGCGAKARDRVDAAKTLLERGFGKAIEIQAIANLDSDDAGERAMASGALARLAQLLTGKDPSPREITIEAEPPDRGSGMVADEDPTALSQQIPPVTDDGKG